MFKPIVAIPTLVGSLSSAFATSCVLICYIIYADQQRSFRHALVLNLALAEFINSLNNSISGIYVVANRRDMTDGAACDLNGWVGQWSVQAADFSILAIAIVTLLTITRKTYMPNVSTLKKLLICASCWIMPTISASTALGLGEITPVSGNWCWISAKRTDLRYGLGHAWRFTIIILTLTIYAYIWIYMRRHFSTLYATSQGISYDPGSSARRRQFRRNDAFQLRSESQTELHEINVEYRYEVKLSDGGSIAKEEVGPSTLDIDKESNCTGGNAQGKSLSYLAPAADSERDVERGKITTGMQGPISHLSGNSPNGSNKRNLEKEIQRMLLLNAYPIMYIILWTPGILNRLVEAAGHKSYLLAILQCSTQFVGLANAITYGFNEHLRKNVKAFLRERFKR